MKILKRQKAHPINLAPGDSLSVTYREQDGDMVNETTLTQYALTEPLLVDTIMIARPDAAELDILGLQDALAAIVGEEKRGA